MLMLLQYIRISVFKIGIINQLQGDNVSNIAKSMKIFFEFFQNDEKLNI